MDKKTRTFKTYENNAIVPTLAEDWAEESFGMLNDDINEAIFNIKTLILFNASEIASYFVVNGFDDIEVETNHISNVVKKRSENIDVLNKMLKQLNDVNGDAYYDYLKS